METFYVTFGGLLLGWYMPFEALSEDIVRAYMNKRSNIKCWCTVYAAPPENHESLKSRPVRLEYSHEDHI